MLEQKQIENSSVQGIAIIICQPRDFSAWNWYCYPWLATANQQYPAIHRGSHFICCVNQEWSLWTPTWRKPSKRLRLHPMVFWFSKGKMQSHTQEAACMPVKKILSPVKFQYHRLLHVSSLILSLAKLWNHRFQKGLLRSIHYHHVQLWHFTTFISHQTCLTVSDYPFLHAGSSNFTL